MRSTAWSGPVAPGLPTNRQPGHSEATLRIAAAERSQAVLEWKMRGRACYDRLPDSLAVNLGRHRRSLDTCRTGRV